MGLFISSVHFDSIFSPVIILTKQYLLGSFSCLHKEKSHYSSPSWRYKNLPLTVAAESSSFSSVLRTPRLKIPSASCLYFFPSYKTDKKKALKRRFRLAIGGSPRYIIFYEAILHMEATNTFYRLQLRQNHVI